jgi:hypothetical protein
VYRKFVSFVRMQYSFVERILPTSYLFKLHPWIYLQIDRMFHIFEDKYNTVKYKAINENDSSGSRTRIYCPSFKKECLLRNSIFYVRSVRGVLAIIVLLPWLLLYSFVSLDEARCLLNLNVVVSN